MFFNHVCIYFSMRPHSSCINPFSPNQSIAFFSTVYLPSSVQFTSLLQYSLPPFFSTVYLPSSVQFTSHLQYSLPPFFSTVYLPSSVQFTSLLQYSLPPFFSTVYLPSSCTTSMCTLALVDCCYRTIHFKAYPTEPLHF